MIILRQKEYKENNQRKRIRLRQALADRIFYTRYVPAEVMDRRIRDAATQGNKKLMNLPENEGLYNKAAEIIRKDNVTIFDKPEQQSILNYPRSHTIFKPRFSKEKNIEELSSTIEGKRIVDAINNSRAGIYLSRPAPMGTASTLLHEYGHIQNSDKRPFWWRLKEPFMKKKDLGRYENLKKYIYSKEEELASRNSLESLKNLGASNEYLNTSATTLRASTVDPHRNAIRRQKAMKLYYKVRPSKSIFVPSDVEKELIKSGRGVDVESQREAIKDIINRAYEEGRYPYLPKPLKY